MLMINVWAVICAEMQRPRILGAGKSADSPMFQSNLKPTRNAVFVWKWFEGVHWGQLGQMAIRTIGRHHSEEMN